MGFRLFIGDEFQDPKFLKKVTKKLDRYTKRYHRRKARKGLLSRLFRR